MTQKLKEVSLWVKLSDGSVQEHPTFLEQFKAKVPISVAAGDKIGEQTIEGLHFGTAKSARRHFK